MGVMTGAAGGFLVHDMETMAAAEALGVQGAKTLITKDAVAIVALVAERVVAKGLRAAFFEHQLAFEDRSEQ